jgi:hypothetical protein
MKKKLFCILFLLNILSIGSIFAYQQFNYKLPEWLKVKETNITRDSILIGDQVVLSTTFSMPQDKEISFIPYSDAIKLYSEKEKTSEETLYDDPSKIEVVKEFKLDTISIKKGIKELQAKLLLTCLDSGYYKLPDILAVIKDGDSISFKAPTLEVVNVQIDTTNFEIRPLKGQINYPVTLKEILTWVGIILGILILIAAIVLLILYIIRKNKNQTLFGKPKPVDPPHIVALRELDRIRLEQLWQSGKEKQFYTGVTDTLREYIEKRYNVSAMEKTSNEILDSLSDKRIDAKPYNELKNLFGIADLVKFAKYTPSTQDNEETIPIAVRFVNSTFMQELEENKNLQNSQSVVENVQEKDKETDEQINQKEED